jgi:hypothetical protein
VRTALASATATGPTALPAAKTATGARAGTIEAGGSATATEATAVLGATTVAIAIAALSSRPVGRRAASATAARDRSVARLDRTAAIDPIGPIVDLARTIAARAGNALRT